MGAILDTKKVLERKLKASFPAVPIAFEGVSFTPPNGQLYLVANIKVNKPSDPTLGKWYYRENITATVFVCDVPNKGTGNAYLKAEEVRAVFDKGFSQQEGSTLVHILETPQIAGSYVGNDRVVIPVLISLTAESTRT